MVRFVFALSAALVLANPADAGPRRPVVAEHGMVTTSQHYASQVGVDILKRGGNAIDAAVAVAYALAVVHPCCGNLGGGGFATIHLANGKNTVISFREKAPEAATADMFLDSKGNPISDLSAVGYKAVAVPGTVLALETMRKRYGTMTRDALMAPAIQLAEHGFVLDQGDVDIMSQKTADFQKQPNVAAIFLNEGKPWRAGDRVVQTDLAQTLKLIERNGADVFYKGPIADQIVAASTANGGILTKKDFADYTVTVEDPVHCRYRGYDIFSPPPPSSGGVTMCEILNILGGYDLKSLGYHSAPSVHLMVEAMRHAFVDRNYRLGDPEFVQNPVDSLLSESHAAAIRAAIQSDRATPSSEVAPGKPPHEGMQTTHFSIVDKYGNAVAFTYTLNFYFGSKVIAGNTGVLLNNTMDDFTAKPGAANYYGLVEGKNNAIAPGKRPLSTQTPSILMKDGNVAMIVGTPGGATIITMVAEIISNVIDYGMDIQAAIDAPRIHHQWEPDNIRLEPSAITPEVRGKLASMGYSFDDEAPWGDANGIEIKSLRLLNGTEGRLLFGGFDSRHPAGAAIGY